jgi:glycosyltransferase involved in cell wall biosynthesis
VKVAVIHATDGSDVRVGKICRSLSKRGHEVFLIGWDRRPTESKATDLGETKTRVMVHETPFGKATLAGTLRFLQAIRNALHEVRPAVVWAVNEDTALLALPFRGVLYRHLICDIADALPDRHSDKAKPTRAVLHAIAAIVRARADRLIATDQARLALLGRFKSKAAIIQNYPEDPGPELAETLPTGPTSIWVGGTLSERNGLRVLLSAIGDMHNVRIVSAGWPYDDFAQRIFLRHPCVEFHGIVTAPVALRLASGCDAVFCYYDPIILTNRNASPNKVYDALAVGRPVIINRDVALADWVTSSGAGVSALYSDVAALRGIIGGLSAGRSALAHRALRLRELSQNGLLWGDAEARLYAEFDRLT